MSLLLGASCLIACSDTGPGDGTGERQSSGKLSLGLVARAPSGNVYRLRNAFFEIRSIRTGDFVAFLSSEDDPGAAEISTILERGDYTVALSPGWSLEVLSSGNGGGVSGATSTGGAPSTGGKAGGGQPGKGPSVTGGNFGFGGDDGGGGELPSGGDSTFGGSGGFGGDPGPGTGGFGGAVDPGGPGHVVEAQLVSDAVQFFSLFGGDEAFISYLFRVGGEVIDFDRGRVHIGIDVDEVEPPCIPPAGPLDIQRTLLENSLDATESVTLRDVFTALADNEGHAANPELLYQQIIDSYATAEQGLLEGVVHCGDETTDGQPSLNGFPLECNRVEHANFDRLDQWFATAFVNRIDLAPQNGAHCGQQRMVFSNPSNGRLFMILEAQIPNPAPELGIQGCLPLAEFWLGQNQLGDPAERGARLRDAFLFGAPELAPAGFGPFYSPSNLTVGSGQIRTNNFNQDPWTLREFKLALDGESLAVVPFPVSESPPGALWNDELDLPQGAACRESFLEAVPGLLSNELEEMSFVVDHECKDAESRNDFSQAYAFTMSSGFEAELDAAVAGTGLSGADIANRAHFAGSCIGCHSETAFADLGNGVTALPSLDFVHVGEFLQFECQGSSPCFAISEALTDSFLPRRASVLMGLLGIEPPPNPCDGGGGGAGGAAGAAGAGPVSGGAVGQGGSTGTGGFGGGAPIEPAPVIELELPQVSTPVDELQEQDAEIREEYGDLTLGNRSAQSTH